VNVPCPECRSVFRVDPAKVPSTTVRARCSVCGGVITVTAGSSIEDEFSANSSRPVTNTRPSELSEAAAAQRANAGLAAALLDTLPSPRATQAPAVPSLPQTAPAGSARGPALDSAVVAKPQNPSAAPSLPSARPVLFPPRPMMPGNAPGSPAARPIVAPRPAVPAPSPTAVAPPPSSAPAARPSLASTNASTAANPAPAALTSPQPVPAAPRPVAPNPTSATGPTAARTPINPFLANDPHAKAKRLARALVSDLVTYFPQKRQDGLRDGTLKQLFKDEIQKSYEEYVAQIGREFAETTPHFQEALNDLLAGGQKVF
jgi:predicted Zn finger-like uncharacterized protein